MDGAVRSCRRALRADQYIARGRRGAAGPRRASASTMMRSSAVRVTRLPRRGAPLDLQRPPNDADYARNRELAMNVAAQYRDVGVSLAGHVATVEIRRPPHNYFDNA